MRRKYDVPVLFGLCVLGFTQPQFSLLSQYPEFFTSHKLSPEQLWFFTIVTSFVLPLCLSFLLILSGFLNQVLRTWLMIVMVTFLGSVIALPFLNKLPALNSFLILFLSVLIGLILAWFYLNKSQLQSSLAYLSLISILVPLNFIYSPGIRDLAFSDNITLLGKDEKVLPVPVVVVIFDEFTINSIVNLKGEIDEVLYPNLAWFSHRAHWFSNATTVADGTAYAVPAILSGQYAKRMQPTYQAYPTNIFSLLHPTHTFNVHESASKLCPSEMCPAIEARRSNQQQLALVVIDSLVLYAHMVLPIDVKRGLPDVSQGWTNYLATIDLATIDPATTEEPANEAPTKLVPEKTTGQGWLLGLILSYLEDDRAALWYRFLASIPNTPQPSLNLIHILLPHLALEYLPSGKNYGRQVVRDLHEERWGDDEWAIKQAWQRHLLQLAYTDKLLGALFNTLGDEDLFDDALIIITADHGLSFKKGVLRRPVSDKNFMDILPVPLFVKLPGQDKGSISNLNVETVDILPTILDVLNISPPAALEGMSVFDTKALKQRKDKRVFTFRDGERTIRFAETIKGKQNAINERIMLFGNADDPDKLFSIGSDKNWVGKLTGQVEIEDAHFYKVVLKNQVMKRIYAIKTGPNFVSGTIFRNTIEEKDETGRDALLSKEILRLALVVNDKIVAVTKTYLSTGDREFAFLVPESAYQDIENRIEIFQIEGRYPSKLRRFHFEEPTRYSMSFDNDSLRSLVDENGNEFMVDQNSMMGFLDSFVESAVESDVESGRLLKFEGWAVDKINNQVAHEVVLFMGGKFITSSTPQYSRPDVAAAYDQAKFKSSGYRFFTETLDRQLLCKGQYQIFAISGAMASVAPDETALKNSSFGRAGKLSLPSIVGEKSFCSSK